MTKNNTGSNMGNIRIHKGGVAAVAAKVATGLLASTIVLSLAACGGKGTGATDGSKDDEVTSFVVTKASETTVEEPAATTDTGQVVEEIDVASPPVSEAVAEAPAEASATASEELSGGDDHVSVDGMRQDGVIDTSNLFTERDLRQVADTDGATAIAVVDGQDVQITDEGTYVVTGEASDATIVVDAADNAKVQLVLAGVSITNSDFPAIYIKNADKVFVTVAEGTDNSLQVTGSFATDGETNTDAVIFSKDDLALNGLGTLRISSSANGVSCKDDLKVTGGNYEISSMADALEANDSVAIASGTIRINAQKDGIHAEDDEDDTTGFIYVCGGALDISASSDAMQATTFLQVDGGSISAKSAEGIEATYVQVNGGDVAISASDDGINATYKSGSVGTPTIEIRGGSVSIDMGAGDTDALDANGNLFVSGGTVIINAQSAFDFDGQGSMTGGTVTVNGSQVTEIANSMMGGGRGMMMGGGMTNGGMRPSGRGAATGEFIG